MKPKALTKAEKLEILIDSAINILGNPYTESTASVVIEILMALKNTPPLTDDQKKYKADLTWLLKDVCGKVPSSVTNGSYCDVVNWKVAQKSALTIANKPSSSISELTSALSNMERFK
jgi:hypothetical protein